MKARSILLVEDEVVVSADLEDRLVRAGYAIAGKATTAEQAIERARVTRPDLVLMDIQLDGPLDGVFAAEAIAELHRVPVVYLSAHVDELTLGRALAGPPGPFGYVSKPFDERNLLMTIETALHRYGLWEDLRRQLQQATDERDALRSLLPVCGRCGRARSDAAYLDSARQHLQLKEHNERPGGMCPDCESAEAEADASAAPGLAHAARAQDPAGDGMRAMRAGSGHVEKLRVPVRLSQPDKDPRDGWLLLFPARSKQGRAETVLELLNSPRVVIPFIPAEHNDVLLLTRNNIEWISIGSGTDESVIKPPGPAPSQQQRVELRFLDEGRVDALIEWGAAGDTVRLSDYLNQSPSFIAVRTGFGTLIVNKKRIRETRVIDDPNRRAGTRLPGRGSHA